VVKASTVMPARVAGIVRVQVHSNREVQVLSR
jgi:hypothetical protein